jgi:hypothetical protein
VQAGVLQRDVLVKGQSAHLRVRVVDGHLAHRRANLKQRK